MVSLFTSLLSHFHAVAAAVALVEPAEALEEEGRAEVAGAEEERRKHTPSQSTSSAKCPLHEKCGRYLVNG
jgi:hypothetical protein